MKSILQAAVKVSDRVIIEIDSSITRVAAIRDGTIFEQQLTPEGHLLFKRLEGDKP